MKSQSFSQVPPALFSKRETEPLFSGGMTNTSFGHCGETHDIQAWRNIVISALFILIGRKMSNTSNIRAIVSNRRYTTIIG